MKHKLLISLFIFQAFLPEIGHAGERTPLEGRAEGNWRYGSERSILMTEFWVPFAQNPAYGSVFYGDLRIMGDDQDNREFNIGTGYRAIQNNVPVLGNGVAGGLLWYDRRLTERGSAFNQITVGGEWLGDRWDVRLNAYMPLNEDKTFTQANPNGSSSGFVGNQVVTNTDQTVVEEALAGVDLELGWKLDFLDEYTDSTRVYAAGFHFEGDRSEDVSGWRTRIATDITSDVQVGARFQRDDVRGSQGFLEATIRFPFGQKKSYKRDGLYARLDESPERDIDIVSNEAVTEAGNNVALLNAATGQTQNIVHVDNTAAGGGDGSIEAPFDTLAAGEGAAVANDVIYVHRGNGMTTGQNAGITLNDDGQMLIGSGSALVFDGSRFSTPNGNSVSSTVLIPAGLAPVITNGGGSGIIVSADDVQIAGLTVNGATTDGISTSFIVANEFDLTIQSVTLSNNGSDGLDLRTSSGASINAVVTDSTFSGNGVFGAFTSFADGGAVDTTFTKNIFTGNTRDGFRAFVNNTSTTNIVLSENNANLNTEDGLYVTVDNSSVTNISYLNNNTLNNTSSGFTLRQNNGAVVTAAMQGNTATGNGGFGSFVFLRGAGTGDVTISNNTLDGNARDGLRTSTRDTVNADFLVSGNTANSNVELGMNLRSEGAGSGTYEVLNNTVNNNTDDGLLFRQSAGVLTAKVQGNTVTGNGSNGIQITDSSAGTQSNIDFGGGSLGSLGQNSVFGNTSQDVRIDVDLDEVKAENNWWGVATGLAGGEMALDSGTVDADPFLTSAP